MLDFMNYDKNILILNHLIQYIFFNILPVQPIILFRIIAPAWSQPARSGKSD